MNKRIALVTGANKGIGLETCRQLGQRGVTVILGARNPQAVQEAVTTLQKEGIEAHAITLDVTKPSDITTAAATIERDFGRLDILINNAGVLLEPEWWLNSATTSSEDLIRKTFETNFFATINLTNALLPALRKGHDARIVNISSSQGSLSIHADPQSPSYNNKPFAYDASKAALNAYTIHLAHALKDSNISVFSAHPGWVQTDMGGDNADLTVVEGAKTGVDLALDNNVQTGSFTHLGATVPW